MKTLVRISEGLDAFLTAVAKIASWSAVILITITVFDVITRRFFVVGSTQLQELEWHFHTILFMFLLGYAYLRDAHVRIDLVRERLPERAQWWIELFGCLLFLIPYCALIVYFSYDFWERSFLADEGSSSATGLPNRWIIKAALPLGFTLLGLAGLAVALRKIVELFGPPNLREEVHHIEDEERVDEFHPTLERGDK